MSTRTNAREAVIALLYAHDCGNTDAAKFATDIFEDRKIKLKKQDFPMALLKGTIENLEQIDSKIASILRNWDFDRLGSLERAILRLGTYEIIYEKIHKRIIINEMLEISKKYGDIKSTQFINGVLDKL